MNGQRLQPVETPATWPHNLTPQTTLQEVLHEAHWNERATTILALAGTGRKTHYRWAARMASCASGARIYIDPDVGKVARWIHRCKHRLCPFCARMRTAQVADKLLAAIKGMPTPRIMILTVKSNTRPLPEQLQDLRRWFAKLRRTPLWKHNVKGGAYTMEVTRNPETGLWHPHLHAIYDGNFIPQKLLATTWHRVTGHSEIVWLQQVHNAEGAAVELSKYSGKPADVKDWPAHAITEYASATNGVRLAQSFGNVHGKDVNDADANPELGPNTYAVSVPYIVHLANRGHEIPMHLAVLIAERWPMFAPFIYHAAPQLEPPMSKTVRLMRMLRNAHGTTHPPPSARPPKRDQEIIDAELFTRFTIYRKQEQAGIYESPEMD